MSETIEVKHEIERRWLIDLDKIPDFIRGPIDNGKLPHVEIKQWYLNKKPVLRIRSEDDKNFIFCIKTSSIKKGIGKPESESPLTREEFNNLLLKVITEPIVKTRYFVKGIISGPNSYYVIHLDILHKEHEGIIFAEVEFPSEEEAEDFIPLNWFGEEVTNKHEYSNSNLAKDKK